MPALHDCCLEMKSSRSDYNWCSYVPTANITMKYVPTKPTIQNTILGGCSAAHCGTRVSENIHMQNMEHLCALDSHQLKQSSRHVTQTMSQATSLAGMSHMAYICMLHTVYAEVDTDGINTQF